jgi:hypothetical protein
VSRRWQPARPVAALLTRTRAGRGALAALRARRLGARPLHSSRMVAVRPRFARIGQRLVGHGTLFAIFRRSRDRPHRHGGISHVKESKPPIGSDYGRSLHKRRRAGPGGFRRGSSRRQQITVAPESAPRPKRPIVRPPGRPRANDTGCASGSAGARAAGSDLVRASHERDASGRPRMRAHRQRGARPARCRRATSRRARIAHPVSRAERPTARPPFHGRPRANDDAGCAIRSAGACAAGSDGTHGEVTPLHGRRAWSGRPLAPSGGWHEAKLDQLGLARVCRLVPPTATPATLPRTHVYATLALYRSHAPIDSPCQISG